MIPGTFNVYVSHLCGKPECLVYNTLTKGAAVVPEIDGQADFSSIEGKDRQVLEDMMILVASREQERKVFRTWLYRNKYGHSSLAVTILTTRNCNLSCSYCYQKFDGADAPRVDMTPDITGKVAEWIKRYVSSRRLGRIHVTFYGGEPLCNVECITAIGDALLQFGRDTGVQLLTYLVTNGTLATPRVIEALRRYNLTHVQVTLDGPPSIHDSRRMRHDGSGSFREVLDGLKRLSEVCPVIIRCNVEEATLDNVPDLLTMLAQEGLAKRRNVFDVASTFDFQAHCSMVGKDSWNDRSIDLLRLAKSMGFSLHNPLSTAPCFAVREGCFTFDVDGSVYACSSLAGDVRGRIGNVAQDRLDENYYDFVLADGLEPECYDCRYLPTCMGGCRASMVQKGKPLDSLACAKDSFERHAPELLRAVYE